MWGVGAIALISKKCFCWPNEKTFKRAFLYAVCDLHHRALPNNLARVKRSTCLQDHHQMISSITKGKRHEYDETVIKEPLLGMATPMVE